MVGHLGGALRSDVGLPSRLGFGDLAAMITQNHIGASPNGGFDVAGGGAVSGPREPEHWLA